MLSRIADSLFWLSRYMERNDCLTRMVRTHYILDFDAGSHSFFHWNDLIQLFASPVSDEALAAATDSATALPYLINNARNHNAARVLISRARENARGVQDNITKEVWEQVNQLYHLINQPGLDKKLAGPQALDIIDQLELNNTLFYGVTDSTMPRGLGWNFMNLGKFIERSLLSIDVLQAHFAKIDYRLEPGQDLLYWKHLLYSLSGYELYLKKYTRGIHNLNVIDHAIFNPDFPRSVVYSLQRVRRYFDDVALDTKIDGSQALQKSFGRICSRVEFTDTEWVRQQGLAPFLQQLRADLIDFSNQLTRIYFSYA